jgi:hypothetical protein
MSTIGQVQPHMRVIGADGVHVGTVDAVKGNRIKLVKADSGAHVGHHHYLSAGLIAGVEDDVVRLSANGDAALLLEEEEGGEALADRRVWNWSKIGVGAVAAAGLAAAATGAAAWRRRQHREEDEEQFELHLATDENLRLISSTKVEGTAVVDRDGKTIGHIQSFMVDKYSGRVAYAIMRFGGTLGLGTSLFPLPWSMLDYDTAMDGYALDVAKSDFKNAPRFEAGDEPEFNPAYRRVLIRHYGSGRL